MTAKAPRREPGLSHKNTLNFLNEKRIEKEKQGGQAAVIDRGSTLKIKSPMKIKEEVERRKAEAVDEAERKSETASERNMRDLRKSEASVKSIGQETIVLSYSQISTNLELILISLLSPFTNQ